MAEGPLLATVVWWAYEKCMFLWNFKHSLLHCLPKMDMIKTDFSSLKLRETEISHFVSYSIRSL